MTRRRDKAAEPFCEIVRFSDHVDHHLANTIKFVLFNAAWVFTAGQIRIAVMLAAQIVFQRVIGKAADQIAAVWPTETDGVVQRGFMGKAVVRESWWNVEDIARLRSSSMIGSNGSTCSSAGCGQN
jgi:hypothetical protein